MTGIQKHSVTVMNTTQSADCRADQTMLDSLLRSEIWIPNSCNQGTCGTCKVKILLGEVDHRDSPMDTLTAEERKDGMALACQGTPCSDIQLKTVNDATPVGPQHKLQDFVATVTELIDIAEDTRRLTLQLDKPMNFSAGQYVEVFVPHTGEKRHYSMANSPVIQTEIELHIRRVPDGQATDQWIFSTLREGEQIELSGPYGDFTYADDDGSPLILVGGGTGMAPLISIMDYALGLDPQREIHLYQGARSQADLYDVERLTQYVQKYPNFHYVPALSMEDWNGRIGHVTDVMVEDFSSCKGYSGYLCGPPLMVDSGIKAFKRRRMAPRRIYREKFTSVAAVQAATRNLEPTF